MRSTAENSSRGWRLGLAAVLGALGALELLAAPGFGLQEPAGSGGATARVRWSFDPPGTPLAAVVGQVVPLRVEFELDEELLQPGRLAPKRRPLDLAVELALPWLGPESAGGARVGLDPAWEQQLADPGATSIVINGEPGRVAAGSEPGRYGIELLVAVEAPGALTLEPPALSFERVSATRLGLFGEELPGDVERVRVAAEPLELVASEPPLEGRPIEWGGAVGELTALARVPEPVVFEDESIRFELELRGLANFGGFEAPGASAFGRTQVRGFTRERGPRRETIRYDLAPGRVGEFELPSVRLGIFRPAEGRYAVLATEPVRVRVLPRVKPGEPAAPPSGGAAPARARAPWWVWPSAGAVAALLGAGWVTRRRRG